MGIVRKTIYNNHRTKYRLVRKSGGGGGGGGGGEEEDSIYQITISSIESSIKTYFEALKPIQ